MGWAHLKFERTTALCVKLNTWACRGIPQAKIWSECPMYGKRKSGVFFAVRVGFQVCFLEISQRRQVRDIITTCSNVQVTITVTCLNFAVTGSRILLHPLSSSHREKPSRKIALNSNGEVNYRELARRPWDPHRGSAPGPRQWPLSGPLDPTPLDATFSWIVNITPDSPHNTKFVPTGLCSRMYQLPRYSYLAVTYKTIIVLCVTVSCSVTFSLLRCPLMCKKQKSDNFRFCKVSSRHVSYSITIYNSGTW